MRALELQHCGPVTGSREALVPRDDLADPKPAGGEVLLEVQACAVCHTELDQIEGRVAACAARWC